MKRQWDKARKLPNKSKQWPSMTRPYIPTNRYVVNDTNTINIMTKTL